MEGNRTNKTSDFLEISKSRLSPSHPAVSPELHPKGFGDGQDRDGESSGLAEGCWGKGSWKSILDTPKKSV